MADRTLVNSYLRSARRLHPNSNPARLAWLDLQASELDVQMQAGDWEVGSSSFAGGSASSKRNVDARDRLDAIDEAVKILTADSTAVRRSSGIVVCCLVDANNS